MSELELEKRRTAFLLYLFASPVLLPIVVVFGFALLFPDA